MSEKFNGTWQKVKDVISFAIGFIPIILLGTLSVTAMLLIKAVIKGAIVSVCWNVAMTTMFGFQKIAKFQAFALALTIGCLRTDYLSNAKLAYEEFKKEIFQKCNKEKVAKICLKLKKTQKRRKPLRLKINLFKNR